ncbi:hypothetical protein [Gloeobacter violaceus]|uniref:hypothetical protein n=1 Tax=Gloeobacter violaceus TaxID=33072 RepID=UPI00031296E4|nr:hypothetical protein [Gloeobacter violaceus]
MTDADLSLSSLYRELVRVAPRVYLPLLVLQWIALAANLAVGSLPQGPVRGATQALVPLVLDPVLTGTSLAYAHQALTGTGDRHFGAAFSRGVRTWPKLIATSILTVGAAMLPTAWLFYFAYRRFEAALLAGAAFWEVAVPFGAMIVLAVPGIYLGVRLFVTVPLHFVEEHGALSPLPRSWRLTEGHWWAAALAFMPLGLLVALLALPLSFALVGTPWAERLLPGNAAIAGIGPALRLVGPLGWTLYMLFCLRLIASGPAVRA